VHRALAALPALDRALRINLLPWSKVRLVARVATPDDIDARIACARAQPTRRLEQAVRANARAPATEDLLDPEPTTRVTIRCTPAVRETWNFVREVAERVAGERLRAEDALEWVAAEVASSLGPAIDPLAHSPSADPRAPGDDLASCERSAPSLARAPARTLPAALASLARGLEHADAFELDRRLGVAIRLEQTLDAAIAPLLRLVGSAEYEWRGGHCRVPHFAREQLGMSVSKARSLLRLERTGDLCPETPQRLPQRTTFVGEGTMPRAAPATRSPGRVASTLGGLGQARHRAVSRAGRRARAAAARRPRPRLAPLQIRSRARAGSDPAGRAAIVCARRGRRRDRRDRLPTAARRGGPLLRAEAAHLLRGNAGSRARDVARARSGRATTRSRDRARRLPLRRARLHVAAEPARPPHRVPLGRRVGCPRTASRCAPSTTSAAFTQDDCASAAERPARSSSSCRWRATARATSCYPDVRLRCRAPFLRLFSEWCVAVAPGEALMRHDKHLRIGRPYLPRARRSPSLTRSFWLRHETAPV